MDIEDVIKKAALLHESGSHSAISEMMEDQLDHAVYGLSDECLIHYCAGMGRILSGDIVKGLTHLVSIIRKISVSTFTDNSSDLVVFSCFAAMQSALIAEFCVHHNQALMSLLSEKSATFAKDMAEIAGVTDINKGAADILSRVYYSPSGKPFLMPPSPSTLQIEPTNICNLKCIMCPRLKMHRREGYMSMDLFVDILKGWSGKMTSLNFTHLVFGKHVRLSKPGSVKFFFLGEPLLHPEFDSMIRFAVTEGCHVAVQTNGTLLMKRSIAEKLIASGVHEIGISIDGINHESYSRIRKGSEWEKIVSGIKKILEARTVSNLSVKPKIEVSTIIPEKDASMVAAVKKFLNESLEGVDSIRFIELDRSYSPDFIDENMEFRSHGKILQVEYSPDSPLCMEPFSKLNILWDGTVTPCCHDIDGNMVLGSVKYQKIDEIWRGDTFSRLLQALASHELSFHPLCRTCRFSLS